MPEDIRQQWFDLNQSFSKYKAFLKHSEWAQYSKSSDGYSKIFTRVSSQNLLCLKSISHCRGEIEQLVDLIADTKIKPKYDDTIESLHFVYENLPFDMSVLYQKHKKILVVSPRDLIILGKVYRISKEEVYIMARAIDIPSIPPQKNIVRAFTPLGGWRLKVKQPASDGKKPLIKMTFFSEIDFKISLFI